MKFYEIEELARYELSAEVGSTVNQSHISPAQILAYANEAENEACRRARILVDSSTPAICQVPIVAGTSVYDIDDRIIFITRGKMTGGQRALSKASHVTMDEQQPTWETDSGTVESFVTGLYSRKLRLYKIPTSNGTLNLTVIRRPLTPMVADNDEPEIPTLHHPALILWIKHKAFNNLDSEVFDRNKADIHLAEFERYFGKRCAVDNVFDEMLLLRSDSAGDDTSCDYY